MAGANQAGKRVGMESEIASPPAEVASGSAGAGGRAPRVSGRPRGWWWLVTALAVCASLVVGATVEHVFDQRNAALGLYRTQVLTTVSRFIDEEGRQIALPPSQRSAAAFGDLTDFINSDQGVNGSGTLQVSLGAGSAAPSTQIAFSATVASPYASSTIAVWYIQVPRHGGLAENDGACVLGSTLLGSGRATNSLNLGGGETVQPCAPGWWSSGPANARQPDLGLAGIPKSPR